jgi:membrane-bound metal-dependent hydrolase YbcI (DUF457 family)
MPLAVTHVLSSILLVDFYRDFLTHHKKYIRLHTIFLAGLGGLLPDIDMVITFIFSLFAKETPMLLRHGGITHTPLFALLFLIPGIILWKKKQHIKAMNWFVIAFGIFLHIFLDFFLGGGMSTGIMWFFPFSQTGVAIHLLSGIPSAFAALDAIFLLVWLYVMDKKRRVKDYI